MPAYVIALIDVHDPQGYQEYIAKVPATIARHGGKYLVRTNGPEAVEGHGPGRMAVLEFASMEQARAWYRSPEYQAVAKIRQRCSTGTLLFVPAVPGPST